MRWPRLCELIGIVLLGSMCAWSQINPDLEQGMRPYGSYHGGDLDHISLSNGNLFFHANLFFYSQRAGDLAYPIVLQYNGENLSLFTQQSNCATKVCPTHVVFGPPWDAGPNSAGSAVMLGFEGMPTVVGTSGPGLGINTGLSLNGNPIFVRTNAVLTSDGSLHPLANTDFGSMTLDGSGFRTDSSGFLRDSRGGNNYSYDPENRITGAAGYVYSYDADGNRVEKSNGSTGTIYWYMTPGIVAESDLSGNLQSEYVFFNGKRVARKDFSGSTTPVSYYFSDELKTADVITDSVGTIKAESDYYPYGGELQFVNNDANHYKFTGKERDTETGLDYFGARYYGNWLGRFMSADWAAKPEAVPYSDLHDPQSLNLYSYVRNIPTSKTDADGHDMEVVIQFYVDAAKGFFHWLTSGPPPHAPVPDPLPTLPRSCVCPPSTNQNQNSNSKQNNNSQSQNTGEQGRDAQGKFVSKQPGQTQPGSAAEKEALDAVGATKNTEKLNGTIRDGTVKETGARGSKIRSIG